MKYLFAVLSIAISALSAVLTFKFTHSLGVSIGLGVVMGAMGIALDCAKSLMPAAIVHCHKQGNTLLTIALSCVTGGLMLVSFSASIFAVDTATQTSRVNSDQYQAITEQVKSLRLLSAAQVESNHITKAAQTEEKITTLINKRSNMQGQTMLDKHADTIAIIIAAAIEIVGLTLTIMSSVLSQDRTQTKDAEHNRTPNATAPVKQVNNPEITVVREQEPPKQITFVAKEDKQQEIKEAVIARAVYPSIRGVREVFSGISNEKISDVLKELGSAGILAPKSENGKGWVYA